MESNLKCFFLRGKYRVSDDFLVLILLIFGGLRYFFYYLCRKMQKWAVSWHDRLNSFQAVGILFLQNKLSLRGAECKKPKSYLLHRRLPLICQNRKSLIFVEIYRKVFRIEGMRYVPLCLSTVLLTSVVINCTR